ncbi:BON domain-containing protein [Pseudolysinimonas sp.]|uniref:BON domain-containing protein n=1 Tax=Pseudolysinimonas sp. TaxID=2680009 RepID=UPI003F7CE065
MTITAPAHRDHDIQVAVQDELQWTPEVEAAGIGVAVDDGTVTLSGETDSYAERVAAMHAALRVRGVRAVVDEMIVHPRNAWSVTETDIAKEVERALKWASDVPDTIKAQIDGRRVTLTGSARWNFQRTAAERAVRYLRGVYAVKNDVVLDSRPSAIETEDRIRKALARNAQIDADTVAVKVTGTQVTLTGTVHSWAEKQQAGIAAWGSPHVTDVDNRIVIRV